MSLQQLNVILFLLLRTRYLWNRNILLLLDIEVLETLLSLTNIDLGAVRAFNMTIGLSNNILLGSTRELAALVLLNLDLLLRCRRGRVSQLLNLLPLLISLEVSLNGLQKLVECFGDGGLEDLRREDVLAVVGVHLSDGVVDEGFAFSALHDEAGLAGLESRDREEDEFDEAEDAVFFDDLGSGDLRESH